MAQAECQAVPGEYLVRFRAGALPPGRAGVGSSIEERAFGFLRELRADRVRFESAALPGLLHIEARRLDEGRVRQLQEEGVILYIEPNCKRPRRRLTTSGVTTQVADEMRLVPNDARFGELWGFDSSGPVDVDINAPEAWSLTTGNPEIVVGVLDGGVNFEHEDLRDSAWTNPQELEGNGIDDDENGYVDDVHGANVLEDNGNVRDTADDAHGSHGAGTIAAVGNNGVGVVGVSWNAKVMAISIFRGEDEGGSTADVLKAWEYALMMRGRGVNLRVLNNSYGGSGENPAQSEIEMASRLGEAGILLVLSSGNDGRDNDADGDTSNLPTTNALTVAASSRDGELADFSNFGATTVDLAAPGVGILSTVHGNDYAAYDGTSQAGPFVAGVAALLLSREPDLTPEQVRERLMSTVRRVPSMAGRMVSAGVVDALAALRAAGVTPPTETMQ